MPLRLIDQISTAGGGVNEDRTALAGTYAWVFDGATDVLDEPLTTAATDADWIAGTLDANLRAYAANPVCAFADLSEHLTASLSDAFAAEARRQPRAPHEHPSASGLILKYNAGVLSHISIGDCSMIVADEANGEVHRCGISDDEAGDIKLNPVIRAHLDAQAADVQASIAVPDAHPRRSSSNETPNSSLLETMRPKLQLMRARMNREDGYGVFSITPTPDIFIRSGFMSVASGTRILLATDGFMRLVDVFRRYDPESLLAAASRRGLAELLDELRTLERCRETLAGKPRIKPNDDASALLIEVID